MSGAFVNPKVREPVEVEGTIFFVRSMTATERFPILMRTQTRLSEMAEANGVAPGELEGVVPWDDDDFALAVATGLVGWEGEGSPEFSRNQVENINLLSDLAYLAIGSKVLNLSFAKEEDLGNS